MPQATSTDGNPDSTKLLGVRIDRSLHQAVRRRAFDEDRSLSDLVRDALQRYLDEVAEKAQVPA